MGWGLSEVDFRGAVVWVGVCKLATEHRKMKNTKNKSTPAALVIPGADDSTAPAKHSICQSELRSHVLRELELENDWPAIIQLQVLATS